MSTPLLYANDDILALVERLSALSFTTTITGPVESLLPSLSIAMLTTTMNVGDTAVKIPATPLAQRRAYSISNLSSSETLYIGTNATITAGRTLGTLAGWEIGPLETFNTDIKPALEIYGIANTGQTILVKVLELA